MQQEEIQDDNEEQIDKKIKPNIEKPKSLPLLDNILGMIFEFFSTNEKLQLRLVVQQFNSVVKAKLQQLLYINHYKGSFSDYEKFISQFECLRELALPAILSIQDQPNVKQLQKIKIDDSFLNENEEAIYFQTFFERFEPISLSLCKFRLLQHIPIQKFQQIKELDLLKVMTLRDKQFLYDLPLLVSFAAHFQEKDPFFQSPDFPELHYLKMLKIRLEGPNILENQIPNFESFIKQIPNLEVLELHYYTYHSTQHKQAVFDLFLSLPKLRVLLAFNSLKEIEKHQFKKMFDYIIIDNNSQLETQNISDEVVETLLGFSKILDLTNCRLGEEQQQSIQNFIDSKRQQAIQSENQIKVSFEHQLIKTHYESYPIVQRNDAIKTLWGTKYYNFN